MPAEARWKPSCFNIHVDHDGKRLFFNSVDSRILELSGGKRECFEEALREVEEKGHCADLRMQSCLKTLGFIVPESEDEYERERRRFEKTARSTDTLRITIAPTLACNLRCSYCFQQGMRQMPMLSPKLEEGVIEFVERKLESSKALVMRWFGGEPLLALPLIARMTEKLQRFCADRNIVYYAEMLTNGVLLTPARIDQLADLCVRVVHLPLDGTPAEYAERRGISRKQAEAYHERLLDNMPRLLNVLKSLVIRINVDRGNAHAGEEVVRLFKSRGYVDPRIDFRLGFLNTMPGIVDCIPHDCFSLAAFADVQVEFREFLAREGFRVFGGPELLDYPCGAPLDHCYMIDPLGRIGKCVPCIGTDESVFTRIYPEDIARTIRDTVSMDIPYLHYDPYSLPACAECKLLPQCLGACPRNHTPNGVFQCALRDGLADRLAFFNTH
ncbi:MAG: radical SAM protein [Terracidiphilus sp.]